MILPAEDRLSASAITASSMMLSLVFGGQVDCMMKMSWPRTLSFISIQISPSLKLSTFALPILVFSFCAIFFERLGFAFPVNSISLLTFFFRLLFALAGLPGFEPGYDGIKSRCLTAWRQPILSAF